MPRKPTGRRPYSVRILPATVDEHRDQPDEQDSDVLRRLIAAGVTHLRTCAPNGKARR